MPAANTEAMQKHLDEIARNVVTGAHAIVLLDQAGAPGVERQGREALRRTLQRGRVEVEAGRRQCGAQPRGRRRAQQLAPQRPRDRHR